MMLYNHQYLLHTEVAHKPNYHFMFGTMAHEVLEKAGRLRDEYSDGVSEEKYYDIIPSEVLYSDLKQEFQISSWTSYFTEVIKQVAKYESQCIIELFGDPVKCSIDDSLQIFREKKLCITVDDLKAHNIYNIKQSIVGVVDFLAISKTHAYIIDYKFSTSRKTQDDFDINSQLPLYALMVHYIYGIPLHNIKYGYIDIPKKSFDTPTVLSNGTLSRSKAQNVSAEFYEKCVKAIHGEDDEKFNCKKDGYYYDAYCNLLLNKAAYLSTQYLDESAVKGITSDLFDAAAMIDYMIEHQMKFIKKYSAYTCKGCDYLPVCKPWLEVDFDGDN